MEASTKALIFVNLFVFIVHLVLNSFAGKGGNKLFPNNIADVSKMYPVEITPVDQTFAIWGIIYLLQVAWIIYSVTTVFRSVPASNTLSDEFYICYIMILLCLSVWLVVWARKLMVASLLSLVSGQCFMIATIYLACRDLYDHLVKSGFEANADVWCVRMLVQNGILFYGTWTMIATLLNFTIVVGYKMGYSTFKGSIRSLLLLGTIAIAWFVLESFVFKEYCDFTFTAYVVLIIGLGGILARGFDRNRYIVGIVLTLFILSIVFLIARISIIAVRASDPENRMNNSTLVKP